MKHYQAVFCQFMYHVVLFDFVNDALFGQSSITRNPTYSKYYVVLSFPANTLPKPKYRREDISFLFLVFQYKLLFIVSQLFFRRNHTYRNTKGNYVGCLGTNLFNHCIGDTFSYLVTISEN